MSANNRQSPSRRFWKTSLGYVVLAGLALLAVLLWLLYIRSTRPPSSSKTSPSPQEKAEQQSDQERDVWTETLGTFGPFLSRKTSFDLDGFGTEDRLRDENTRLTRVCARLTSQWRQGFDSLLLVVGSSDRQPLKGPSRNRYDANVGLASARAQSANEALEACTARSGFPLPGSNNSSLILVAGPRKTPEGAVSPDDLSADRHVDVIAIWSRSANLHQNSEKPAPSSLWAPRIDMAAKTAAVASAIIAFIVLRRARRRNKLEETIRMVEKELYDENFVNSTDIIHAHYMDLAYAQTGFFDMPQTFINAGLFIYGHYQTVLARADAELLDKELYKKLSGIRMRRNHFMVDVVIKSIRAEIGVSNWGEDVEEFTRQEGLGGGDDELSTHVLVRPRMSRLLSLTPQDILDYLNSASVALKSSHSAIPEEQKLQTAQWFVHEWEPAPRAKKLLWIEARADRLRKEIRNLDSGVLTWDDFSAVLDQLDQEIKPSLDTL
jgi:hypothetical protein